MSAKASKTYEVILNGAALGLKADENIKRVSAVSFDYNPEASRVIFLDANGKPTAVFQNVFSVMEV